LSWLITGLYVFARLGGLFLAMPVVSARGVPKHVAVLGAAALTLVLSPIAPQAVVPRGLGFLILGIAGEAVLGILIAGVIAAIFGALALAAELMENQMGSRMAGIVDPFMQTSQGPVGTLCAWLAGLAFLAMGFHLEVLALLGESLRVVPPGSVGNPVAGAPVLMAAVGTALALGVQLAGPVLALCWLVNVFVAILVKLAPNMNIFFSIGLVLTNVAGLALLSVTFPWLMTAHGQALRDAVKMAWALVQHVGG
jgi:flagellar biosynthetic protein FliR